MGGIGSGRHAWRSTLEDCQVLDIRQLRRRPGFAGAEEIRLCFQVHVAGERHDVTQTVHINHIRRHLGGSFALFVCPGRDTACCERNAAKLYSRGSYFLCRACHDLAYKSQSEDTVARAMRSAGKIKQRLGGNPDLAARFPRRPKGMWTTTYERQKRRYLEARRRIDDAIDDSATAALRQQR